MTLWERKYLIKKLKKLNPQKMLVPENLSHLNYKLSTPLGARIFNIFFYIGLNVKPCPWFLNETISCIKCGGPPQGSRWRAIRAKKSYTNNKHKL
jgi:hypothetical protein